MTTLELEVDVGCAGELKEPEGSSSWNSTCMYNSLLNSPSLSLSLDPSSSRTNAHAHTVGVEVEIGGQDGEEPNWRLSRGTQTGEEDHVQIKASLSEVITAAADTC